MDSAATACLVYSMCRQVCEAVKDGSRWRPLVWASGGGGAGLVFVGDGGSAVVLRGHGRTWTQQAMRSFPGPRARLAWSLSQMHHAVCCGVAWREERGPRGQETGSRSSPCAPYQASP